MEEFATNILLYSQSITSHEAKMFVNGSELGFSSLTTPQVEIIAPVAKFTDEFGAVQACVLAGKRNCTDFEVILCDKISFEFVAKLFNENVKQKAIEVVLSFYDKKLGGYKTDCAFLKLLDYGSMKAVFAVRNHEKVL